MRDWCPQVTRLVALTILLAALPCSSAFAQGPASTSAANTGASPPPHHAEIEPEQ